MVSHMQWFEHFKNVFSDESNEDDEQIDFNQNVELSDIETILFNSEISDDEILGRE